MSGRYSMARGWQKHAIFGKDEFSRRDAWAWMIGEAVWKDSTTYVKERRVELKRGQFTHSIRFMSEAWGWNKAKVERFLGRLKTETMIETVNGTVQAIITICNYDEYQLSPSESETANETESGTVSGQFRDREEEGKERKEKKGRAKAEDFSLPEWLLPHAETWEAFLEMRRKAKKYPSAKAMEMLVTALERICADGTPPDAVMRKATTNEWMSFYPLRPDEIALYVTAAPAAKSPTRTIGLDEYERAKRFIADPDTAPDIKKSSLKIISMYEQQQGTSHHENTAV